MLGLTAIHWDFQEISTPTAKHICSEHEAEDLRDL